MMAFLLSAELTTAITTTLLHSLWQITLVAFIYKYAQTHIIKNNSLKESQLGLGLVMIIITMAALTFIYSLGKAHNWIPIGIDSNVIALQPINDSNTLSEVKLLSGTTTSTWINNIHFHITITWFLGVLLLMCRVIWGYIGLQRLRNSLNYSLPPAIVYSFSEIRTSLKISQKVQIATSELIDIPMMFGHLKPVVILPLAVISQMNSKEIEFIIAHELGHVLRNDYLKNIVIVIAETLFFFHPLLWWVTGQIKQSREHHCDEISIECFPNRMEYAKSLIKIESIPHQGNGQLSLALFTNKHLLMKRIKRILNQPNSESSSMTYRSSIGAVVLFIGLFIGASWISKESKSDAIAEEESETTVIIDKELHSQSFAKILSIDTIKPETIDELNKEREEAQLRIEELQDEIKLRQEERMESIKKIKEQYESQVKQEKQELKELQKKYRLERKHLRSDEEWEEVEERLEELGERMENWMEENSEEWESRLEDLGEQISETFDDEWAEKMEASARAFEEQFDEDWGASFEKEANELRIHLEEEGFAEGMEEFGAAMAELGAEIGETVAEAMHEVNFEDLSYDIEFDEAEDSNHLKLALGREMASDFELKKGKNKLQLTRDQLIVNGKRANDNLLEKYIGIMENGHSKAFRTGKTNVKFHFFGLDIQESDKTSLSIRIEE